MSDSNFVESVLEAAAKAKGNKKPTISKDKLRSILVDQTKEKTSEKGSVYGIRGSIELFGEPKKWELFKEYYQSPKSTKKNLRTKWVKLEEALDKAIANYDPDKDRIDCSKWNGIPVAAFTPSDLEVTLVKTITNYQVMGVPLTFGIMSALLFLHGLITASPNLKNKISKKHLSAFPYAFIVSELGMYEAGTLGGMKPEILTFLSNMFRYQYWGTYDSPDHNDICSEWLSSFGGESWEPNCQKETVFEVIEFAFCIMQIGKLIEKNRYGSAVCPCLIGYTFDSLTDEDCLQLGLLSIMHRRAAQGAGTYAEEEDSESTSVVSQIDDNWFDNNFTGNHLMEIASRELISAMQKMVDIKTITAQEKQG